MTKPNASTMQSDVAVIISIIENLLYVKNDYGQGSGCEPLRGAITLLGKLLTDLENLDDTQGGDL